MAKRALKFFRYGIYEISGGFGDIARALSFDFDYALHSMPPIEKTRLPKNSIEAFSRDREKLRQDFVRAGDVIIPR